MKRWLVDPLMVAVLLLIVVTSGTGFAGTSEEVSSSCVAPARGPLLAMAQESAVGQVQTPTTPVQTMAKVGRPAPDFEANAFVNGQFKNIKLSDFKGRWVALCFYPGDFTFV